MTYSVVACAAFGTDCAENPVSLMFTGRCLVTAGCCDHSSYFERICQNMRVYIYIYIYIYISFKLKLVLKTLCALFFKVCFARMLLSSDLKCKYEAVSGVTREHYSIAVDIRAVLTCGCWRRMAWGCSAGGTVVFAVNEHCILFWQNCGFNTSVFL
jgi:hypothetical protein